MVIRVQAALMRRGFYNGDIDGLLGPKTRAALQAFQESEGISQTGRMDRDAHAAWHLYSLKDRFAAEFAANRGEGGKPANRGFPTEQKVDGRLGLAV